jgi:membrane-associated protease RseP (regulator of RpoE activity)
MLHQVAWAGWAGLLVTTMNLIPAGQLDGGHIFYALFGKKAAKSILPFILGGLALLGFFWNTWWLWAVLIFILGRTHAEPLDQITRVDKKRQWLGVLAIAVFILTFIPVPISLI